MREYAGQRIGMCADNALISAPIRAVRRQHEPGRKDLAPVIARGQLQITTAGLVPAGQSRLWYHRSLRSTRPGAVMLDTSRSWPGHRPVVRPHEIPDSGISHRHTGKALDRRTETHERRPQRAGPPLAHLPRRRPDLALRRPGPTAQALCRFTNRYDPDARSRRVFTFQRPETLTERLRQIAENPDLPTFRARLKAMPPLDVGCRRSLRGAPGPAPGPRLPAAHH
jgi:hypothetical protein